MMQAAPAETSMMVCESVTVLAVFRTWRAAPASTSVLLLICRVLLAPVASHDRTDRPKAAVFPLIVLLLITTLPLKLSIPPPLATASAIALGANSHCTYVIWPIASVVIITEISNYGPALVLLEPCHADRGTDRMGVERI